MTPEQAQQLDLVYHALFDAVPGPADQPTVRRLDLITLLAELYNSLVGYKVTPEHLQQWGLPPDPRIVGGSWRDEMLIRQRDAATIQQ